MNKRLPDYLGKKRIYNSNFKEFREDVIMWEVLPISNNQELLIRFISTNSKHRQGIRIAVDCGNGEIIMNENRSKSVEVWADECSEAKLLCVNEEGFLSIYNIFERLEGWGKGKCSQMDYSGMLLEKKGNIYKYSCNDTGYKMDFNSLVFEIELV